MKYYVIEDVGCYYVESETDYSANGHIIAECFNENTAKFISEALAKYTKKHKKYLDSTH